MSSGARKFYGKHLKDTKKHNKQREVKNKCQL